MTALGDLLELIAAEVEVEQRTCGRCAAHDEHEVCDFPDIAAAIRRATLKLTGLPEPSSTNH